MQTKAFSELFPLFNTAAPETLEWLLSVAVEHEYPSDRAVLMEDAWGNAVYFVVSGWVKVRRLSGENVVTLAILGKGDFFGEMAILDESPRSTDVIALSPVELLSVSAQRFIQTLFKDPQLHHRMLQLMVKRLRQTNLRFQMRHQPPAVKLANTLIALGENYGEATEKGTEIYNIPSKDLANVTDIGVEDTSKIIEKLESKGWIKIDPAQETLHLLNIKQLTHLAGRV
ncbi:Crp/Fnr family transcriptional regulator [Coleofasciculus sp. FACHB-64]|uniref:Crp/Fnr family transcriptional regulator n=1 Tax=Cyanophyceae TaxID=3028117 RepID=UPI001682512C|nr:MULTISPECIES: Crp/Fnr family transcriptional regulator [unclassified Coleofasciculus]MBD1839051.1 Crp/Fnr family transcriptional regulator [Coleofasciculus sp. FACHB-501]MBD1881531.1 Crp/Fnr family transcriptional regulator [Coleofasciculus sp. FACHB-T130]MBD1902930.1 Crp/Fnr family transcriptional regulator [Coleofasciculus sp. FACHB-125]MBD2048722.1 Crp/Fnr family transcriptional regulator [Coleofasciculus sp. FACHB-64]MBD2087902.1 Crp/Fnr family transcriptional regulator [Coleofasciculus